MITVIVPLLQIAVYICLLMSLMLLYERVYMLIIIVLVKLFLKKPDKRYKFELIHDDNFPLPSGPCPNHHVQLKRGRANEWIVTAKLGSGQNAKGNLKGVKRFPKIFKFPDQSITLDLGFAAFLFVCGCYDFVHGKNNYFIYLFLQSMAFFFSGLGWTGT